MVTHRAYDQHRRAYVHQRHAHVADAVMAIGQRVVEEQRGQVFVVHALGQPGQVGVPAHHVVADLVQAHQIAPRIARPDQIARIQELERARHLPPGQIALLRHVLAQRLELVIVDKDAQFAGFAEVGLGGQQRDRGQFGQAAKRRAHRVVAPAFQRRLGTVAPGLVQLCMPSQRRRHDGQESAAQAIAQRVDARSAGVGANGADGFHHTGAQVVLHAEGAVRGVRVAPGNHEHLVALGDQVAHHGVGRRQVQDVVLHDA